MYRYVAVLAIVLGACSREPAKAAPKEACLADDIHLVRSTPEFREACATLSAECRRACDEGDMDSCFYLATWLGRDEATRAEAQRVFERVCRDGLANGCTNWAANAWARETEISDECMLRMFEKTCEAGDPFGCGMLGRYEIEARKSVAHHAKGFMKLERSCRELQGPPCHYLAMYIEEGVFGKPDKALVADLKQRACDGGDDGACGEYETVDETMKRSADMTPGREPPKPRHSPRESE